METNRRRQIVVAVAITLFIGVFASLSLPFLLKTPTIVLPLAGAADNPDGAALFDPDGTFVPIVVVPETVQSAIASLNRSGSYYRTLVIERWGSEDASSSVRTTVEVWKQGPYERVELMFPDGSTQNRLMDGENIYLWQSGDRTYHSYPADQRETDLTQEVPTYEAVLALDPQSISDAGYVTLDGQNFICVEYDMSLTGFVSRYWVSLDTGLLVEAEISRGDELKYSMRETSISFDIEERLIRDASLFTLPDQTKLK